MITAQWTPFCDGGLPYNPEDRDPCPGWLEVGGSDGQTRKGAMQAAKRAGWCIASGGRLLCPRCAKIIELTKIAGRLP